jgi:hypothetical protein
MILSNDENVIISTLGWIDHGSLWILKTATASVSTKKISDAPYLALHRGEKDYFAVVHHYDNELLTITAHSLAEPDKPLAYIRTSFSETTFDGDKTIWRHLPRAFIAYLKRPDAADFFLFLVDPVRPGLEILPLDWYDDSYDKGYQGVIGVVEVPGQDQVIISVQRDSHPILYDVTQRKVIGKLTLADRRGNPRLYFRRRVAELWADDYDTLLRLSTNDWHIIDRSVLQADDKGMRQFIGEFSFDAGENLCAVARPFSGDVVAVNTQSFRVVRKCTLGGQPLLVTVMSDGTVFSRDWQTGQLLAGKLKRKWF